MSLQVWLPLNGSLANQGLSNCTISGTATYDNNGKIGKCAYTTTGITASGLSDLYTDNMSISFWMKSTASSPSWQLIASLMNSSGSQMHGVYIADSTRVKYEYNPSINIYATLTNWNHYAIVLSNGKSYGYLNGSLYTTSTEAMTHDLISQIVFGASGVNTMFLNDMRVYNHCLSAKEVKEISKGLVLHYRLSGPGNPNLLRNASLYTNGTKLNRRSSAKDGYVSIPLYYNNLDTTKKYTLSVECDGTIYQHNTGGVDPTKNYFTIWLYYSNTAYSDSSYSSYTQPTCYTYSNVSHVDGSTKYYWTFTPSYTCCAVRVNTYADGTTASNVNFWNFKLEEGSVATPWCPNSADALYSTLGYNNGIEYDCSGYGRNGTKSGTITWDVDSPRYTTSYKWPSQSSATSKIISPELTFDGKGFTAAVWVKFTGTTAGGGTYHMPLESSSPGYYEMSISSGGILRAGIYVNGTRYVENCSNPSMYDGKWHHIAMTYNGTKICRYVDAKAYVETSISGTANGTNQAFYLGQYGTNTTYYNNAVYESDARIYATALPADDIAELYHTAGIVDNAGNTYAYEFVEEEAHS